MGDVKENQKVCLITGAGRGLGRVIAIDSAKNGHHAICINKSETNCSRVTNEFLESGNSSRTYGSIRFTFLRHEKHSWEKIQQ